MERVLTELAVRFDRRVRMLRESEDMEIMPRFPLEKMDSGTI